MKVSCILFSVFLTTVIWSQYDRLIILKNGSEIRGKIVDSNEEGAKIRTKDGSIWSFSNEEIARIEKFKPKVSGKGFFTRAELGVMGGSEIAPSLQVVNGYSINSHWDAGLGIGVERIWWDGYIPIYLNGRYNLLDNYITPFVDGMAGYNMPMRDWEFNKGGPTAGLRIGVTRYFANRCAFSTSLGYRYVYLKRVNTWWDDFDTFTHIHRYDLRIAFTFK